MEHCDRVAISELLLSAFNSDELEFLIFKHLPDAEKEISGRDSLQKQVLNLVKFCERRGKVKELCAAAREERPEMYEYFFGAFQEDHQKVES